MKFQPKTEKELAEANNIPVGDYAFEVLNATDKLSKAGNEMIELTLRVHVGESARQAKDYLMEAFGLKLLHFCECTGLHPKYLAGTFTAEDCLGKTGFLIIGVEKGKLKDDGKSTWPDKSTVKDYVRALKAAPATVEKDVPFGE